MSQVSIQANVRALLILEGFEVMLNTQVMSIKYDKQDGTTRWFVVPNTYMKDIEFIADSQNLSGMEKTNFIKENILEAYYKWVQDENIRFVDMEYIRNGRALEDYE